MDDRTTVSEAVRRQIPTAKHPPDLSFWLPGAPRGKGRPRSRIVRTKAGSQFVSHYPDQETESYEAMLRFAGEQAMRAADLRNPFDCALRVRVTAIMPIPMSWSARKQVEAEGGLIRPTGKPDMDNLVKILDAVNKVVWRDDALIVEIAARKFYGVNPGLRVEVWRWIAGLL